MPREIAAVAGELGYPVAIKAAAGGGGYGMRVANAPEEVAATLEGVRRDAGRAFGDTTVYVEKFFSPAPRHVEIQVLGDRFGQRRPPRRAGVLAPAPLPEDRRGDAFAGGRRGASPADG